MTNLAINPAQLLPKGEGLIALESVQVDASLTGLLAEASITQTYRNLEAVPIEAVYTFPLSLDAVLLELALELNGRRLKGVVHGAREAAAQYEKAVDDGDTAVLLERTPTGLYTLNLANLLPGETAVIRLRYAQLLRWQGDRLRFYLPTTIAPRYGSPDQAGLAPHQTPEYVLIDDRRFGINVYIRGALADADMECPSHAVGFRDDPEGCVLSIAGGRTLMDRDFVLVLRHSAAAASEALVVPDRDGQLVLASFYPALPKADAPRCVKLVVDCSGSMQGDSIQQARVALKNILDLLGSGDYFNIVRFGSTHHLLFEQPVPANDENMQRARQFVENLQADLGGTEIAGALQAAFANGTADGKPADVLLITDGHVWAIDSTVALAKKAGHRIFTVGVGMAITDATLQGVAEATGGAAELVTARENMAERIVRHFQRMDQARTHRIEIQWPGELDGQSPAELRSLYEGDTVHVFGWLKSVDEKGRLALRCTLADGSAIEQELNPVKAPESASIRESLPRVAAFRQLGSMSGAAATELAVRYQLVTDLTSCVLTYERGDDDKAQTLPALRKVPHVVVAGWGGMGITDGALNPVDDLLLRVGSSSRLRPENIHRLNDLPIQGDFDESRVVQKARVFLRRPKIGFDDTGFNRDVARLACPPGPPGFPEIRRFMQSRSGLDLGTLDLGNLAFADLEAMGLGHNVALMLELIKGEDTTEAQLSLCFLAVLMEHPEWKPQREFDRLLRRAIQEHPLPAYLLDRMRNRLAHILRSAVES